MVSQDDKVQRIVEMGFDEASARQALRSADGDENAAIAMLLSG